MQPADCANGRGRIALAALAIIFDLEQEWNPEPKKSDAFSSKRKGIASIYNLQLRNNHCSATTLTRTGIRVRASEPVSVFFLNGLFGHYLYQEKCIGLIASPNLNAVLAQGLDRLGQNNDLAVNGYARTLQSRGDVGTGY